MNPRRSLRRIAGTVLFAAPTLIASVLVPAQARSVTAPLPAQTVYAAPDGTGSACSAPQPCSISQARQEVRALAPDMRGDIVVQLAGGTYRLDAPLQLSAADSGRNGHQVIWQAAPGQLVTLSGGVAVTGWTLQDAARHVWVADTPDGADPVLQLYVNGVRAVRDRSAPCPKAQCKYTSGGITGAPAAVAGYAHPEDMELVTHAHWRDFHCPVTAATPAGGATNLTLAQPCWTNANLPTRTGWQAASPSGADYTGVDYLENAYELLGTPGQFYTDPRAGKLYYVPRAGEDMTTAQVTVPLSESLLTLTGTVDQPVHDIAFRGLSFADAAWREPATSDGYASGQAGWTVTGQHSGTMPGDGSYLTPPHAAVTVLGGRRIDFADDMFSRLGGAGVALRQGTHDSSVESSHFSDISAGAVVVGDVDPNPADPRLKAGGNTVRDNIVDGVAVEYRDSVGIWGGYQNGLSVDHNTVENLPYTGISVGWGWDFVGSGDVARDVVISNNHLVGFMQQLMDGGAIYVQGQSWDSQISGNYIDYARTQHDNAIYLDEHSRYWYVTGNVVWNMPAQQQYWLSAWASYSGYNYARSNWTTDTQTHIGSSLDFFAPADNYEGLTTLPDAAKAVIANAGAGTDSRDAWVTFTMPTGTDLRGLVDVAVDAPADTRSVQFSMDGTALSELTSEYSLGTGLTAQWRTATDAGYFPPGQHELRATALTPAGDYSATMTVTTHRTPSGDGSQSLDGAWQFATARTLPPGALSGDTPPAVRPDYDDPALTSVVVPDAYGAVRDRWNLDEGDLAVYRTTVDLPTGPSGTRTLLDFGACYFACRYYLNGTQVGSSVGGNVPVHVDVTAAAHPGTNLLAVVVDNRLSTVEPYGINATLYWNWGGLTADVDLRQTRPAQLTAFTAEGAADGTLTVRATGVNTTGTTQAFHVGVVLSGASNALAGTDDPRTVLNEQTTITLPAGNGTVTSAPVQLHLPDPQLWDPDHPNVYTVRLDGADVAPVQTGFRDIAVRGSDVLLNGQVLSDLHGFNREIDYPGLGRTEPAGLADRELKALRDQGYRIFRPSHYPMTPAELDAADRYGLLVMEEVNVTQANATELASDRTRNVAEQQLSDMVTRDRGHPSLVIWSVGNENDTTGQAGADYVHTMIDYGKALDATRLFTHVTAWHTSDTAYAYDDILAINEYDGWYYSTADAIGKDLDAIQAYGGNKPMVLSEYGAEAVLGRGGTGPGSEVYQAQLVDTYNAELAHRPHFLGQMYWTSTEFAYQEASAGDGLPEPVPGYHDKGLATYWRQPKLAARVMFSPIRISQPSAVLVDNRRQTYNEPITVTNLTDHPVSATLLVTPPNGFTASVDSAPFTVAANATVTISLSLAGSTQQITPTPGTVRAVVDANTEAAPRSLTVVNLASATTLSDAYDTVGITDDSNKTPGSFTTSRSSYSAQALAAAGITRGQPVNYDGITFTWPDLVPGVEDNVEANGELITLSGKGSRLGFLGASAYGTQGGTGTIFYSDGTSSQFSLQFADWYHPEQADHVVATMPYINNATSGRVAQTVGLYYASVPLDPGKTVAAVQLPKTGAPSGPGLHVFTMALAP